MLPLICLNQLLMTEYALVVVLAIVLSGANLIGYIKCSKDAQKQMQNLASNALTTGITVRIK